MLYKYLLSLPACFSRTTHYNQNQVSSKAYIYANICDKFSTCSYTTNQPQLNACKMYTCTENNMFVSHTKNLYVIYMQSHISVCAVNMCSLNT